MFAGIYGGFIGKSECGDIKFMGISRMSVSFTSKTRVDAVQGKWLEPT